MNAPVGSIISRLTAPGAPFELTEVSVRGRPMRAYKNAPATLPELIDAARAHGAKEFMAYQGERWSYDRFFAAVDALAGRLQAQVNIRPGDRIAIAMRNRPEWAVAFFAAALAGPFVPAAAAVDAAAHRLPPMRLCWTSRHCHRAAHEPSCSGDRQQELLVLVVAAVAAVAPGRRGIRGGGPAAGHARLCRRGGPVIHPPARCRSHTVRSRDRAGGGPWRFSGCKRKRLISR